LEDTYFFFEFISPPHFGLGYRALIDQASSHAEASRIKKIGTFEISRKGVVLSRLSRRIKKGAYSALLRFPEKENC